MCYADLSIPAFPIEKIEKKGVSDSIGVELKWNIWN